MLIFVASNEEIEDPALASRFDTIKFPIPTSRLLVSRAMDLIDKSKVLFAHRSMSQEKIERWIAENKINNFRIIESQIEQYMQGL